MSNAQKIAASLSVKPTQVSAVIQLCRKDFKSKGKNADTSLPCFNVRKANLGSKIDGHHIGLLRSNASSSGKQVGASQKQTDAGIA